MYADIPFALIWNTYTHMNFDDAREELQPVGKAAYFTNVFTNFAGSKTLAYYTTTTPFLKSLEMTIPNIK